jgi:hypothetical protein
MSTRMLLTALLGAVLLLAIGCGGPDEPVDGTTDATEDAAEAAGGSTEDWCALLPTDEVEGLFDGQLELEEPRAVEAGGCRWAVVGAEGEGLMATATTPGTFEALAGYEDQSGVETERLDLGEEALLLNGADLVVRRDGGGEIRVALQAFFLSEEMGGEGVEAPAAEVARQAIIDLATLVLERS